MCANIATFTSMKGPYDAVMALVGVCLITGCSAVKPLEEPAWAAHKVGSVGLLGRFGVWDDFHATSHMEMDAFGQLFAIDLETELTGTLGLVGGAEVFIADVVSLQLGMEYRRFKPEPMVPFEFSEIGVFEYFLATRWTIPHPLFGVERLRPFLEAKLAVRPETVFESKMDLLPNSPPAVFIFEGSPSWGIGLAAGLSYQFRDNLVGHFQLLYEWPLTESDDSGALYIPPPIDGYLPLDTEMDSGGMMALFGVTYFL
ncbi:MAG: hypothetical protein QF615_01620 [Planctomycetota bacterium]|nr:hypothetical protein [Planctomycetota bacterium]